MGIFDRFRKEKPKPSNRKSFAPYQYADGISSGFNAKVGAREAVRLYEQCTPFFQAVNMRAEAFSSIPIRVYDKNQKVFIDEHPILDLLNQPNPASTQTNFLKAYSSYVDITGEAYLVATGDMGREPLELMNAKPQCVDVGVIQGLYSVPTCYNWSTTTFYEQYLLSKTDELGGHFRYWNRDQNRSMWQVKEFNPNSDSLRGVSKASPLWLQIQQFIAADTNNFSVLQRGGRPSLAWVWQHETPMTDEQFERWKEQVTAYEGAMNAGRQVAVDNMKPENLSQSNVDMQFAENRKTVREDIFSVYQIPLSMVSADTMTMDNLKVSALLFWDNAVLPHADNLLDELTRFLMPRYKNSENLILTYNPIDIQALKTRTIAETLDLKQSLILTDNELRTRVGYEEIEGGDVIFKPMSSIPAGMDRYTGDNLGKPDNAEKSKDAFYDHCKSMLTADGKPVFSDVEIDLMWDEMA